MFVIALQFILGRTGSGKTHTCYDQIIETSLKDNKKPYILLVPEQFTLQTQRDIVTRHTNQGIINIEVLSFKRLAYKIFDEVGGMNRTVLEETGKSMVVRKVLEDHKKDLKVFANSLNKVGMIQELKSTVTEFLQYGVTNDNLIKLSENLNEYPLIKAKMDDLTLIYSGFLNFIKEKYITDEGILDLLSKVIINSKWLTQCDFWIDGFTGFTPIQYKVLTHLIQKVPNLKITLTINEEEKLDEIDNRYQLFYESKKTIAKLLKIAKDNNITVEQHYWINDNIPKRFEKQPELAHLERYLFRYPIKPYTNETEAINIYEAKNIKSEVDYVARTITELVRDYNYRYKEIAVVTGDVNKYDRIISQCFRDYQIPFFIDQKKGIFNNQLVQYIRLALEVMINNWSYESIISFLRTGLLDISQEEIDLIENYTLAYGIKGKKKWIEPFELPYKIKDQEENIVVKTLEKINNIRERAVEPLVLISNKCKGKKSVQILTEALYNMLIYTNVEDKLYEYEQLFHERKQLLLERQYRQIYPQVIDVLDKIVEILGKEQVTLKQYSKILEAGLEQAQLGLVPPALDQIVIGDIERTRLKDIKILFLIGVNEGVIPRAIVNAGIISDMDKEHIENKGITLAPTTKQKTFEEYYNIYLSLLKPEHRLYLSLVRLDTDFKSLRPSMLIGQLRKLFPNIKIQKEKDTISLENIGLPKSTITPLIKVLREIKKQDLTPLWKEVISWYYNESEWQNNIKHLINGLFHKNIIHDLTHDTVKQLYGKYLVNSVSRLEQYASCPFAHFIKYGLKTNERMMYELSIPDLGIIFHESIENYSKALKEQSLTWDEIASTTSNKLAEEAVEKAVKTYGNHIFFSSAKNEYLIKKIERITKKTVEILQKHIQSGAFKPTDYEFAFSSITEESKGLCIKISDEQIMQLTGRIDRVDQYETDDNIYLKIIDYKSGKKAFDISALYYGLQLQLFVYLNAAIEFTKTNENKEVIPAGIFYYHIDDPILTVPKHMSQEVIEEETLKNLKMDGLVLDDEKVIRLLDQTMDRQSKILPVKFNKNGELSATSSTASHERFEKLQSFVQNKLIKIGQEITLGKIDIAPYSYKKQNSCNYCSYDSVCQFDKRLPSNNYRVLKPLKDETLWSIIEKQK